MKQRSAWELSKVFSEAGRKGGRARLTTMTAAQRKAIATKASKAAAKARIAKAKKKAKEGRREGARA